MTSDDVLKIVFGGFILAMALISRIMKARKNAGRDGAATAAPSAAPPGVPEPRVAALVAELKRRGITPPAALQAIAAAQSPQPPVAPQPPAAPQRAAAPAPPRAPQHRHGPRAERPPESVTPPVGVRPLVSPDAPAPPSPARRMLVEAFGDPAHARTAVILAEILAKPVALR